MAKNLPQVAPSAFIANHRAEVKPSHPSSHPIPIQQTDLRVYQLTRRDDVWYVQTSAGERKLHVSVEGQLYFNADPERKQRRIGEKGKSRAIIFAQ